MPFIKTTSEGKKEVQVRAILAMAFAVGIIAGFFTKLLNPDQFMGIATMAISWYFAKGSVADNKKPTPTP